MSVDKIIPSHAIPLQKPIHRSPICFHSNVHPLQVSNRHVYPVERVNSGFAGGRRTSLPGGERSNSSTYRGTQRIKSCRRVINSRISARTKLASSTALSRATASSPLSFFEGKPDGIHTTAHFNDILRSAFVDETASRLSAFPCESPPSTSLIRTSHTYRCTTIEGTRGGRKEFHLKTARLPPSLTRSRD